MKYNQVKKPLLLFQSAGVQSNGYLQFWFLYI